MRPVPIAWLNRTDGQLRATNYLENGRKSVDADFRNSGGDVPGRAEDIGGRVAIG